MSEGVAARGSFADDLDALRLQVEVMALRVGEAVASARSLLDDPDPAVAERIVEGDDAIDEMHTSLLELCYQLLAREAPVASDLRLVVSVIRVVHELERIGDLAIRVAKSAEAIAMLRARPDVLAVLSGLADNVVERFTAVAGAWSARSLDRLDGLDEIDPLARFVDPLVTRLMALDGDDAVSVALGAMAIGRSLDRIGDHTQIMASRLRYLITGESAHLAAEVEW